MWLSRPQCFSVLMPYLPPASTETLISSFLEIWFLQKQKCVYGKWMYNQLGSYSISANGVKPTWVVKAQIVQDVLGYLCNILNFRWHFRRKSLPQFKISSVLKHVLLPAISKLQTNLFIIYAPTYRGKLLSPQHQKSQGPPVWLRLVISLPTECMICVYINATNQNVNVSNMWSDFRLKNRCVYIIQTCLYVILITKHTTGEPCV